MHVHRHQQICIIVGVQCISIIVEHVLYVVQAYDEYVYMVAFQTTILSRS
jgi:hypothetical protein